GGPPTTSIRHMRQLPAIESRSWKQKRGISAPAASHACSSVYSAGTSISRLSTMSFVISNLHAQVLHQHQCHRSHTNSVAVMVMPKVMSTRISMVTARQKRSDRVTVCPL